MGYRRGLAVFLAVLLWVSVFSPSFCAFAQAYYTDGSLHVNDSEAAHLPREIYGYRITLLRLSSENGKVWFVAKAENLLNQCRPISTFTIFLYGKNGYWTQEMGGIVGDMGIGESRQISSSMERPYYSYAYDWDIVFDEDPSHPTAKPNPTLQPTAKPEKAGAGIVYELTIPEVPTDSESVCNSHRAYASREIYGYTIEARTIYRKNGRSWFFATIESNREYSMEEDFQLIFYDKNGTVITTIRGRMDEMLPGYHYGQHFEAYSDVDFTNAYDWDLVFSHDKDHILSSPIAPPAGSDRDCNSHAAWKPRYTENYYCDVREIRYENGQSRFSVELSNCLYQPRPLQYFELTFYDEWRNTIDTARGFFGDVGGCESSLRSAQLDVYTDTDLTSAYDWKIKFYDTYQPTVGGVGTPAPSVILAPENLRENTYIPRDIYGYRITLEQEDYGNRGTIFLFRIKNIMNVNRGQKSVSVALYNKNGNIIKYFSFILGDLNAGEETWYPLGGKDAEWFDEFCDWHIVFMADQSPPTMVPIRTATSEPPAAAPPSPTAILEPPVTAPPSPTAILEPLATAPPKPTAIPEPPVATIPPELLVSQHPVDTSLPTQEPLVVPADTPLPETPTDTPVPELPTAAPQPESPKPAASELPLAPSVSESPAASVPSGITQDGSQQMSQTPASKSKILAVRGFTVKQTDQLRVSLRWEETQGASGYEIWRGRKKNGTLQKIKTVKGGKTQYTDKKVVRGKTYYYQIVPCQPASGGYDVQSSKITGIRLGWYIRPVITVRRGRSSRGEKYVEISLQRYEGSYADIYVKKGQSGKFLKLSLRKKKISSYRGRYKFKYQSEHMTLFFKAKTYGKIYGKPVKSDFSKVRRIVL